MKKFELVIFESNRTDGNMSRNEKFYPKDYSETKRRTILNGVKDRIGKKYGFNGKHIFQPKQKDVSPTNDYPDGKYIKISEENLKHNDFWDEDLICDIVMIDTNYPNIVIGHIQGDCPVLIAEDRKKQVVATAHCGAKQINRGVPKYLIESLYKEINSKPEDIYVYVGSCIKKESYIYDCYPNWATNKNIWQDCITQQENNYYIDLNKAIRKELLEVKIDITHIIENKTDTYTSPDYYSHTEEVRDKSTNNGQNYVGCFYREKEE